MSSEIKNQLLQTHSPRKTNPGQPLAPAPQLREERNQQTLGILTGCLAPISTSTAVRLATRQGGTGCAGDTAAHRNPKSPLCASSRPGPAERLGETRLSALSVTRGPAPATTASLFNSQQLYSHSARQIDFTSPQLNVDNYGSLHQGTALPGLRRKNHIPIPLML